MGHYLFANYIHLFEIILMLEQFLRQRQFHKNDIHLMKNHVTAIMNLYKDTVNRKTGMGDNLVNIHLIRHMADDIMNLGLPLSFDSAPGENRHISAVKIPASRTQHQMDTFHEQIGMLVAEDIAIDRGYNDIDFTLDQFKKLTVKENNEKHLRNQVYRVTKNSIERKISKSFYSYEKWPDQKLYQRILVFFNTYIFPNTMEEHVYLYTEYAIHTEGNNVPTEIYRADPLYKHGGWNDWVYVNWNEYGDIPAKIILFFEIAHWIEGKIAKCNDTFIMSAGKYALCYMVAESINDDVLNPSTKNFRAHASSFLVKTSNIMLEKDPESDEYIPKFGVIEIDSFSAPCIAVPYELEQNEDKYYYMFLEPRSSWPDIFLKFLRNEIKVLE